MPRNCFKCQGTNIDTRIEKSRTHFDSEVTFCQDCGTILGKKLIGEYIRLREIYEQSTGFKIYNRLKELEIYKYFVVRNLQEVLKRVSYYEKNHSKLWSIKDSLKQSRDLDGFMHEFLRVSFNYLTSVIALQKKTIGLKKHLNKHYDYRISEDEYAKKLNDFKVMEFSSFLQQLRNKLSHQGGFQYFSFAMSWDKEKGNSPKIVLKELNKEVKEVFRNHTNSVNEFSQWFKIYIKDQFAEEIKEAKGMNQRILEMENRFEPTGITLTEKELVELKGHKSPN